MASAAEAGATFGVKDASGNQVFSASVGSSVGSWSSTYSFVYALDFDAVATTGDRLAAVPA